VAQPSALVGRCDPFPTYLGLHWLDDATVAMTVRPEFVNPGGRLLGPVGVALVDYAMCSALSVHLGPGQGMATMDLAVQFVGSASSGTVTARAAVEHLGRTTASLRCDVRGDDGILISALGRFALLAPSGAADGI
jgi:uncharacterized protein (TIGR00369 family)